MHNVLNLQRKIVPELSRLLELRYDILRQIEAYQPVGRRALSVQTGLSERSLRAQVDFLKGAGFLDFSHLGMSVTDEGSYILDALSLYVKDLKDIAELEKRLVKLLPLTRVVIVPGDVEKNEMAFRDMGQSAAAILKEYVSSGAVNIAISGGTAMRMLAESIMLSAKKTKVIPARGGLGDDAKREANAIAAFLAGRIGGSYRQIYIPDRVSEKTLSDLLEDDKDLENVINLMKTSDIMIHGIGRALDMAKRRGVKPQELDEMKKRGAVGEALGTYYAAGGKEIRYNKRPATLLDDFSQIKTVMAVAGGRSKADAIMAVAASGKVDILVTDYAAASSMMVKLENKKKKK